MRKYADHTGRKKRSRDRRVDDKRMLETTDERAGADEPLKSRELHNIDSADDFDGVWQHSAERHSAWPFFERQQQPNAIEAAQDTTRKDEAARFREARLQEQLVEAEAKAKQLAIARTKAEQQATAAAEEAERLRAALRLQAQM